MFLYYKCIHVPPPHTHTHTHLSLFVLQQFVSYTCHVSGPGLKSAIGSHSTHVLVELSNSKGSLCLLEQYVTAELELLPHAPIYTQLETSHKSGLAVAMISPSRYKVLYTGVNRGQHKLHIHVNDREINDSPFTVTMYPDPTQLGQPMRVVTGLIQPYGIVYNNHGEMIVTERNDNKVSIIDITGKKIRTFGSHGDSPDQMIHPKGIEIDDMDNIYVSSSHKLQKFTRCGELIKCVGKKGENEGEFNDPRGVTLYKNELYVCDRENHRIQVFDQSLNFIRYIGSKGKGRGEFDALHDVKFDSAGNMYVADFNNRRVQVLDNIGHFLRLFDCEEEKELGKPSGLYIADKYVYVSDYIGNCIVVYETSGHYVTSFSRGGKKDGDLHGPFCITSCVDGFIHVCDSWNNRVQIF